MYFHGLSNDEILSKKRFESYEESCKQSQIRMVTLFGQKVYSSNSESFGSGNGQVNRNCLNPLVNDIDLRLPANQESVQCREFHSISCSQDTIDLSFPSRIEGTGTNWFGKRSEQVITSCGSGFLDLNESPVNEPVANHQQCFFQDLNIPYTEVTEMSSEKSGLGGVLGKDSAASPASCCTVENTSRTEREDSSELIQMAAECLVYISTISLNQSQDFSFKHGSRSNSSYQDQDFLIKPEMGNEKPEYSCDSYERHTLGIRETSPEYDCCVSSNAVDNKKEFGVKLRRGRRMKNFQKEILPGLLSLSRHDIREDLNILEAVLRSNEYKDENGRPNPRNNKGSTPRYVGRRRRRRIE